MNNLSQLRGLVAFLLGFLALTGCSRQEAVRLELQTRGSANREILELQVDALVSGPTTDLHFKWFAVSGTCNPQESAQPSTQFRFAEGVANDRITLEAWRGERLVARAEKDLHFSNELALRAQAETSNPDVFIEFTQIPPLEAGGDHTRSDIAGKVTGRIEPDYRVIVYARAYDSWYIQPTVRALHPIKSDQTWITWTHTGESYAAFVVRADYAPLMRLDVLPPLGGSIKARVVSEGKK